MPRLSLDNMYGAEPCDIAVWADEDQPRDQLRGTWSVSPATGLGRS